MGSGTGFILGGLLSGAGQGIANVAAQNREDALERLRNARQIEYEDRGETRNIASDERKEKAAVANDEREAGKQAGLLSIAADIEQKKGETAFEYKQRLQTQSENHAKAMESIKTKNDAYLKQVQSGLDKNRDEASARLSAEIDSGKIDSIEVNEAGNFVKVYKDGRTETTKIGARATPASLEADQEAGREERRNAREDRNRPGAEKPKARPAAKPAKQEISLTPVIQDLAKTRFNGDYSAAANWVQNDPVGKKWRQRAEAAIRGK